MLATDVDPRAIAVAHRTNPAKNIRYKVHDIRSGLPQGSFTHVIWDGGMAFLTHEELDAVLALIRDRLGSSGVLSGYAPVEPVDKSFVRHRISNSQELAALLGGHFKNLFVFTTAHQHRTNFYFVASDSLPDLTHLTPVNTPFRFASELPLQLHRFHDIPNLDDANHALTPNYSDASKP